MVATITKDALIELVPRQIFDQLSKDSFPGIHPDASSDDTEADYRMIRGRLSSNRKVPYRRFNLCMT